MFLESQTTKTDAHGIMISQTLIHTKPLLSLSVSGILSPLFHQVYAFIHAFGFLSFSSHSSPWLKLKVIDYGTTLLRDRD